MKIFIGMVFIGIFILILVIGCYEFWAFFYKKEVIRFVDFENRTSIQEQALMELKEEGFGES